MVSLSARKAVLYYSDHGRPHHTHESHVKDLYFIEESYAGGAKKRDNCKWDGRLVLRAYSHVVD